MLDTELTSAERARMEVLTTEALAPLTPARIKALFDPGTTNNVGAVQEVKFAPAVGAKVRHGLRNIAVDMVGANGLRRNALVYVRLDLSKRGGVNGVYRFTIVAKKKGRTTRGVLLIEQVAASPPTRANPTAQAARFTKHGFRWGSGWSSAAHKARLFEAIGRIPDSTLAKVAGAKFTLKLAELGPAGESGHYDRNSHEVVLFKDALKATAGSLDRSGADWFTATVAHEIGHAVDASPIVSKQRAEDKLKADLKKAERALLKAQTSDPLAAVDGDNAETKALKAKVAKLRAAVLKANRASTSAKELSDMSKFAAAMGKHISNYAATNLDEAFAELYTLYLLDPALLKTLRPRAHAYFAKIAP